MATLTLLGGWELNIGVRHAVEPDYEKGRALLAYLAVEDRWHSREKLGELFWPGSPACRANLRQVLSNLNAILNNKDGAPCLLVKRDSLRINPEGPLWVDVAEFSAALPDLPPNAAPELMKAELARTEKRAELYCGEFMAGFYLPDCPDFEDWLQIQRETLHRRALAMLEHLTNWHEHASDYGKALQFALRYAELEPWSEDAHRRVMRLYALNGLSSAAIGQFEACADLLKKELGALPSEETQQLAREIRAGRFRREPPRGQDTNDPPHGVPAIDRIPAHAETTATQAERRQVTVLYCELNVAAVDDPDEAMDLLHAPQARCMEIIRQLSGHIVQTHGGGLLAYFGYPQAYEDVPRRAVQAALALTRMSNHDIEIRAGVHTGMIIADGKASSPDMVGKTSRLAIQLRQYAGPCEVTISEATRHLVDGYFDCRSLGVQSLPGLGQPLEIFKVAAESGARSRLDAAAQLTPLVGRESEIATLMGFWREAVQGKRNMVLIQGEAGMGKSRLLHTLKERLADTRHIVREMRCFPEFSQSPYYPLIKMFEAIFGFEHDDTPGQKTGKLAKYLEAQYPSMAQEAIPLLAQLLSLPMADHYPVTVFSPQKQKEQTMALLLNMVSVLSAIQPTLLIVEDLHWIDPSSLEFLTLFVGQERRGAVLMLLTARPEFDPPWSEAIESTLTLAQLAEDEVAKMVASIRPDIPAATIRRIAERTDGVPLFVEEIAKIASTENLAEIPATLHDLLAARLDSMGEAKYTAHLAATFGREFDLNLLGKIFPFDSAMLTQALRTLQDADLILQMGDKIYQFKHALIQEVAYQSQTKAGRQVAHWHVAQALQSDFADVVAAHPELLAQHLAAGGETRQAIEYWTIAGKRAAMNSANAEAIGHYNSGLQLLAALPPGEERDRLESGLRLDLGAVLIPIRGYGSAEVVEAYSRALALCETVGDSSGRYKALCGMWVTGSSRVGHLHALQHAEELLRLAEQHNDPLHRQFAHFAMGNTLFWMGQFERSRFHLDKSMALYEPYQHEIMVQQYGENSYVSSGSLLSFVLWALGFPEQAGKISQQTLDTARQLNHHHGLGFALCCAAALQRLLRNIEACGQLSREAMALGHEHGLPFWLITGTANYGWVLATQGEQASVIQMQQCLDAVKVVMPGNKISFYHPLIDARLHLRQFDQALVEANEVLGVVNAIDDRCLESEFLRLKGECLLAISATNEQDAEACFKQALEVSRRQGAKSLELRAAMNLAKLWRQQGKQEDGRQLLEEIYNWFTEGHDTPDLQETALLIRKS